MLRAATVRLLADAAAKQYLFRASASLLLPKYFPSESSLRLLLFDTSPAKGTELW